MRCENKRQGRDFGNRRKVFDRVKRQFLVCRRVDDHRGIERHEQCIAVWTRLGHQVGADISCSARAIIYHDLLAETLTQFLAHCPRERICRTAGRAGSTR